MKTQYNPDFLVTLNLVGLNSLDWHRLVHTTKGQHHQPTRWRRQFVRKVQRVHSGGGLWLRGQYITRRSGALPCPTRP